jgi:hypothetical protein
MKSLFLIASLALRPVSFSHPPDDVPRMEEINQLKDFIRKIAPGAGVCLTAPHPTQHPGMGWERFPLTYKGFWIWIRRPTVRDFKRVAA